MKEPKVFSIFSNFKESEYKNRTKLLLEMAKTHNVNEVFIEAGNNESFCLDSNSNFHNTLLAFTYKQFYISSLGVYIHPLNDMIYKFSDSACRILNYLDEPQTMSNILDRFVPSMSREKITSFLFLLVRLDLLYFKNANINSWQVSFLHENSFLSAENCDILLIDPSQWHSPDSYQTLPSFDFPLGLGYMGSILQNHGYKVKILNMGALPFLTESGLIGVLKDTSAKVIGISSSSFNFPTAIRISQIVKNLNHDFFTILGGIHPTFRYEEILSKFHKSVDAICLYEGEYTLLELVQAILSGSKNWRNVSGLAFFENGKTHCTPFRSPITDIDKLPFPNRDLALMPTEVDKQCAARIITSRGCPYSCNFCSSSKYWGNHVRLRSPSNIVDEIESLKNKYKIQKISIVDDIFTVSRSRIMEFCSELNSRNIEIDWSCSTRVDAVDKELIKMMKKSGCSGIFYGIESTNDISLNKSHKLFNFKQAKDTIEMTTEEGINVVEAFIIGLPSQSIDDVQNILQF